MTYIKNQAEVSRTARTSLAELPGAASPDLSEISEAELELIHGGIVGPFRSSIQGPAGFWESDSLQLRIG